MRRENVSTTEYQERQTEAVIEIPMVPPVEVSPNWRGHWRKKAKATGLFRATARLAAVSALSTPDPALTAFCGNDAPVTLDAEIAWSGRRRFVDPTNAPALLKAAIDGIADAMWFGQDRHVTIGAVKQTRGSGTVRVTLRGGEA